MKSLKRLNNIKTAVLCTTVDDKTVDFGERKDKF